MRKFSFVIVAVLALNSFDISIAVKVSIYYEALCGDSVNFVANQLHPHYQQLAKYVDLELVPYGKAIHNANNETWEFSCQHGPLECKGNLYQSCVLSMNYGDQKNVDFVNCIMRKPNPSLLENVESCARRSNMDVQKIKSCCTSEQGNKLLAANGDKTWKLESRLFFVPTIIYDDVFDQTSQDQSLYDFAAVVCSKINGTKPAVCDNRPLTEVNRWRFFG